LGLARWPVCRAADVEADEQEDEDEEEDEDEDETDEEETDEQEDANRRRRLWLDRWAARPSLRARAALSGPVGRLN